MIDESRWDLSLWARTEFEDTLLHALFVASVLEILIDAVGVVVDGSC